MNHEPLTVESLARAIHSDSQEAARRVGFRPLRSVGSNRLWLDFDELDEDEKEMRREQARLLLERILT